MSPDLRGKTAVVTGAGRGIGRAIALVLGQAGARVALWSRTLAPVEEAVRELAQQGLRALAWQVDVSESAQVAEAHQATLDQLGPVDILVNNAGATQAKSIAQISEEDWDRIFAVNAKGVFLCSRLVLTDMKQKGWGRIINISSLGAKTGGISSGAHYCAAKAAVNCFTFSLAREMAPYGVCVNGIAPGPTKTEMLQEVSRQNMDEWKELVPLGRLADPAEIAGVALFLCSEQASFLTGEILDVNGGMLMD